MSSGKKLPQYIAAVCICIGAAGCGTAIGWTSNIIKQLKDGDLNGMKITDDNLSWIGSIFCLGCMIMCFPIGWIADLIGRKPTCLLTVIPFSIGWALITFAHYIYMVYIARFLIGIAGGSFCIMAPLYTSEMSQTEIRGTLGTFFQLFITIGIFCSNLFGLVLPMMVYNLFCLCIPIAFGICFFFQPETPVYSIKSGKKEQAEKSLRKLRGKDYDYSGEMKEIEADVQQQQSTEAFWKVFKTKPALKATLICFMLMFLQQLTGINAVMFYGQSIFAVAKSSVPYEWCQVIIGIVQVIATVFSAWAVEKAGRKLLLLVSLGAMTFSLFLLGVFFSLKDRNLVEEATVTEIAFIPLASMIIFIIGFSLGMGPIPWLASSEMFPPEIKAKCSSAAGTFNWLLAFLVTYFFGGATKALGADVPFYFFTAIGIFGIVFIIFFVIETKGKSFRQIQEDLGA